MKEGPAITPALDWLVSPTAFGSYSLRRDSRFTPATLVRLILLWAWGEQATLTDRLTHAQEAIAGRGDVQHQSVSYQAFVKLLRRHSASLLYAVIRSLQQRMRESLVDSYRVAGSPTLTTYKLAVAVAITAEAGVAKVNEDNKGSLIIQTKQTDEIATTKLARKKRNETGELKS